MTLKLLAFEDSELAGIEGVQNQSLRLRFRAACVVGGGGGIGDGAGGGFLQGLVLSLEGCQWCGGATACNGLIVKRRWRADGFWRSALPLPFAGAGPIRLEQVLAVGEEIAIDA